MHGEPISYDALANDHNPALPSCKVDRDAQPVGPLGQFRDLTQKIVHNVLMLVPDSQNDRGVGAHRVRLHLGPALHEQLADGQVPLGSGVLHRRAQVTVPARVLEGAKIGARSGEGYMGNYPSWDASVKTSPLTYENL